MKANSFKELASLLKSFGERESKASVPEGFEIVSAVKAEKPKAKKLKAPKAPKAPKVPKESKRILTYDAYGNAVVKEIPPDEEYVILEDGWYEPPKPDNLLEPAPLKPEQFNPTGNLFLLVATTSDSVLGYSYRDGSKTNYNRMPYINHANYVAQIAKGCIVVMGGNAYRSLLNRGISSIPGVILAVLSKEKDLVLDAAVTQFTDIEELGNHIRAARAVGQKVYINAGPKLLKYFEDEADGAWILKTDYTAGEMLSTRTNKIVYDFPKGEVTVLNKDAPIANISKKPVTLEYRKY